MPWFLSSNITTSPAYGAYVSKLIPYARASSEYRSFCTGDNFFLRNYWHRDIVSQDSSRQLSCMVVSMRLWTNLVFLCPKWYWMFLRPNSFKFRFPLPIFNIHVTDVSTEPGGAYSSGVPGIIPISEFHVFSHFSLLWLFEKSLIIKLFEGSRLLLFHDPALKYFEAIILVKYCSKIKRSK